mgnify:CR=1 FL=1
MTKTLLFICDVISSEGVFQIAFLLQNLQMQHNHSKSGKAEGQQISVHQKHADIHKIKAQECRIAAIPINTGGNKISLIFVRDTRPRT